MASKHFTPVYFRYYAQICTVNSTLFLFSLCLIIVKYHSTFNLRSFGLFVYACSAACVRVTTSEPLGHALCHC